MIILISFGDYLADSCTIRGLIGLDMGILQVSLCHFNFDSKMMKGGCKDHIRPENRVFEEQKTIKQEAQNVVIAM